MYALAEKFRSCFRGCLPPVSNGSRIFRTVVEGDFRLLHVEHTRDELDELAQTLNDTAAQMDRTIQSLSGERNRSSAILRSMVEGVAVVDAQETARILKIRRFRKS